MFNSNAREDLEEGSPPPPSHDDEINQIDVADDRMSATFASPQPDVDDDATHHASSSLTLPLSLPLSTPSSTPSQEDDDTVLVSNRSADAIDDVGHAPLWGNEEGLPPPLSTYDDEDHHHVIMSPQAARSLPRHRRVFAALVLSLLAALVLAVAIGFTAPALSPVQTDEWAGDDADASPPTFDVLPPTPSSSPTTCVGRMASDGAARRLELPVDRPYDSQVAVEGGHAVVVAREPDTTDVHVVFYVLDAEGGGTWEKGNHYVIDYGETYTASWSGEVDPLFTKVSVALSGTSALVGFPYSNSENYTDSVAAIPGEVFVFERIDGTEIWEKKDEMLLPTNDDDVDGTSWYLNETVRYFYFGSSIDIVGDLACVVSDYSPDGWGEPKVYVFRRVEGKWEQIRRLDLNYPPSAKECFVGDEDTLAVQVDDRKVEIYKYDQFEGIYKLIQNAIEDDLMESVSFDNDYLVYSTRKEYDCHETKGFYVYRRLEAYQPYILQQSVNISNSSTCAMARERELFHIYRTGFEASIFHDRDLLVSRGDNRTDVYVKRDDGYWEWTLALGRLYRAYHASGRQLLATAYNSSTEEDEIYYFDLEDCEPSPTQMPSSSQVPSSSMIPSPAPSITTTFGGTQLGGGVYKTLIPTEGTFRCDDPWLDVPPSTLESPPTETCYWVDITIAFDDNPSIMSWDVQKVNDSGGTEVLMISKGAPDEAYQLRNESLCLEGGLYQFTIYGMNGIRYPGYYDLKSDGDLIARGGQFDCSEKVTFPIPFTGAVVPLETSSPSLSPPLTAAPTLAPTLSASPTETCTVIDITVAFDEFPYETSWDIQKINTVGGNEVLKYFDGVNDAEGTVRKESVCLIDGLYRFTIYDSIGDGIYPPGNYNVTTNGNIIVRDNDFSISEESTTFSIPFTPTVGSSL